MKQYLKYTGFLWRKNHRTPVRFSSTHNIANGGESSKLGHYSPLQTFSTVDTDALRKPPLAILQHVSGKQK